MIQQSRIESTDRTTPGHDKIGGTLVVRAGARSEEIS